MPAYLRPYLRRRIRRSVFRETLQQAAEYLIHGYDADFYPNYGAQYVLVPRVYLELRRRLALWRRELLDMLSHHGFLEGVNRRTMDRFMRHLAEATPEELLSAARTASTKLATPTSFAFTRPRGFSEASFPVFPEGSFHQILRLDQDTVRLQAFIDDFQRVVENLAKKVYRYYFDEIRQPLNAWATAGRIAIKRSGQFQGFAALGGGNLVDLIEDYAKPLANPRSRTQVRMSRLDADVVYSQGEFQRGGGFVGRSGLPFAIDLARHPEDLLDYMDYWIRLAIYHDDIRQREAEILFDEGPEGYELRRLGQELPSQGFFGNPPR